MTNYVFMALGLILIGMGAAWLPIRFAHGLIDIVIGAVMATSAIAKADAAITRGREAEAVGTEMVGSGPGKDLTAGNSCR